MRAGTVAASSATRIHATKFQRRMIASTASASAGSNITATTYAYRPARVLRSDAAKDAGTGTGSSRAGEHEEHDGPREQGNRRCRPSAACADTVVRAEQVRADAENGSHQDPEAGDGTEVIEPGAETPRDERDHVAEPLRVQRRRRLAGRRRRQPEQIGGGERRGVQERDPPTAPQQRGHPDDEDHRDTEGRAHQRRETGGQAGVVTPVDRSVVVGQQQLRQPEDERAREEVVLDADAEQHEQRGRARRRPRPRPGAPHDDSHERGDREVQQDREELVGPVAEPECRPQRPIRDDDERRPVLVVRGGTGRRRCRPFDPRGSPSRRR